jgi:hypothetical protein
MGVFGGDCEEKCFWGVWLVVWYLITNVSICKVEDAFNIVVTPLSILHTAESFLKS